MTESPERFAELLTHAIRLIKRLENNKPIRVIQDELGYALGREGGSAIEYWRKGNLPPGRQDVEALARLLVRRGRLDQVWLKDFLESGGCGLSAAPLAAQLFGDRIATVVVQQSGTEPAPLAIAALGEAPLQTPMNTPYFVGRHAELAQLQRLLTGAHTQRLIALVGMGGVGKTALALQTANALRTHFPDGVLWAYTAVSEPLDIVNSWARAYGYDFSGLSDIHSRAAALRAVLAHKQTLVILDDVTSADRVQPLLPGGNTCAVLLTTRSEEIAVALRAKVIRLGELTPAEGFDLLTKILGQERILAEAAAGRAICELLHHLPLAVEIAGQLLAARSRHRLDDMAHHLRYVQHRLDLKISDRQVRTSFLVSWDALDAAQRRLFAHLAVFGGRPFTPDALASVAAIDRYGAQEQLFTLETLSLVTEDDGESYRQHPLLTDFAAEQLSTGNFGDETTARRRMAVYYHEFATKHQRDYEVLEAQWDNLMAGMQTALALGEWALVLAYAETLTEPWFTRAEYARARQGYAWAVKGAQMLQEQAVEARLLCSWGSVCVEQSDYDEAGAILDQGLQIAYRIEMENIIADTHFAQARIYLERSDYPKAEELLATCKDMRAALGDVVGGAAVIYWQGFIAYRHGKYELARNHCLDAGHIQRQEKDELGLLRTFRLLTDISFEGSDFDNAFYYSQQALHLAQKLQDRGEYAAALYNLSRVYRSQGNLEQAEKSAEDSLNFFRQMGSKMFYAFALFELSKIQQARSKFAAAIDYLQQSISQIRLLQDKFSLVIALYVLGDLQMQIDDLESAGATWHEAMAIAQEQNHPYLEKLKERLQAHAVVTSYPSLVS